MIASHIEPRPGSDFQKLAGFIPNSLVNEAKCALARESLKTQALPTTLSAGAAEEQEASHHISDASGTSSGSTSGNIASLAAGHLGEAPHLPPDWPDPRGFTPPAPSYQRPALRPQHDPIITHTRTCNGQDATFTERLATYYCLRDDARFGGWAGYVRRPDGFARGACNLHTTETLAARGGAGEARVLWQWPIRRYEQ